MVVSQWCQIVLPTCDLCPLLPLCVGWMPLSIAVRVVLSTSERFQLCRCMVLRAATRTRERSWAPTSHVCLHQFRLRRCTLLHRRNPRCSLDGGSLSAWCQVVLLKRDLVLSYLCVRWLPLSFIDTAGVEMSPKPG